MVEQGESAMSITFYPMKDNKPCSEQDLNLSNSNAYAVMSELGLGCEPCGEMPVKEFNNRCLNWLKANVGKLSAEVPPSRNGNFIDCGVQEGYLNQRIMQLRLLCQTSNATHIMWS